MKYLTQFQALNKHSINGFYGTVDITATHTTLRAFRIDTLVNDAHSSPTKYNPGNLPLKTCSERRIPGVDPLLSDPRGAPYPFWGVLKTQVTGNRKVENPMWT